MDDFCNRVCGSKQATLMTYKECCFSFILGNTKKQSSMEQ
jgi:hypothetical protein